MDIMNLLLGLQTEAVMTPSRKPMTKAQIVDHFAGKFDFSKATASAIFDELIALAASEVKEAGSFTIPGLGKLVTADRKARTGRNPSTGEEILIPAKTVVKLRLSKGCQEAIVPPKE